MKRLIIFIFCIMWMASCTKKLMVEYIRDLDFMRDSILENHPGVYNQADVDFCKNVEAFYTNAKSKIQGSKSDSVAKEAITAFAKSFNDAHLWVTWFGSSALKKNNQNNVEKKFDVSMVADEVAWITLPTFDLTSNQEKDFQKCITSIVDLKHKKSIVFDLRRNQGGNSSYGAQVIDALFGEEYANQQRYLYKKNVFVDWRVSLGNVDHVASLCEKYPDYHQYFNRIKQGLQNSLSQGDQFYREYEDSNEKTSAYTSEYNSQIIVITDSGNVSAALDFIDELTYMTKNIILIGQKTKADRLYMEIRSLALPSGLGTFSFPIKVYRNRPRLDNEPYTPDIEFQDVANTNDLKKFILSKMEK